MAYRGDEASGGTSLEAPTAEGLLRLVLGPNELELSVAQRSLRIAGHTAITAEDGKPDRTSIRIDGQLVVARDVPHDDLGIWIELFDPPARVASAATPRPTPAGDPDFIAPTDATDVPPDRTHRGMRRIFGVEPVSLLDPEGLVALRRLDAVAQRVRAALTHLAGDVRRATEIGRGLDKVLLADHGDHSVVYARRLFRDRARFALAIHDDGRIVVPEGKALREIVVTSRFGVTVRGDSIRFADRHGTDHARVAIPWIGPEDRDELARRIGQLVHRA